MSDFEKDKELSEKYGDVMGSIADDVRRINLEDRTEERHFDFETESDEFDAAPINIEKIEADDSEAEEVSIEAAEEAEAEGPVDIEEVPAVFDEEAPNDNDIEEIPAIFDGEAPVDTEEVPAVFDEEVSDDIEEVPAAFEDANSDLDVLSCEDCSDMLYDYVSDVLDDYGKSAVEAHLKDCESCRLEYYEIKDMIGVLSESTVPEPPVDFAVALHSRLINAAPDVRAEYAREKEHGIDGANIVDRVRSAFKNAAAKVDHMIRHANWKIVAPAALSAVLVLGVAGSGIYQVMKSSDEIYDFSDNSAIADARATARPSSSGLDDYVTGNSGASRASAPTSTPARSGIYGSAGSGSSSATVPRTTARPGTYSSGLPSVSSSARTGSTGSTSSSSSSSRTSSSGSSSYSTSRTLPSVSSSGRTSSSSTSSASRSTSPAPTRAPYVTPQIILPDIASSGALAPTYVAPETNSVPEPVPPPADTAPPQTDAEGAQDAAADNSGIMPVSGSSEDSPTAYEPKSATEPPQTASPKPTATPGANSGRSGSPTATPGATLKPASVREADRVRNSKGETTEFAEKANSMENASVISCVIEDKAILDEIMNSSFGDCSKIDKEKDGEITLYFDKDDYRAFTDYMKEKNLTYTLVSLGSGDDAKVTVTDNTEKSDGAK